MNLELKHLASYLPYKLKVINYEKPLNARLVDLIAGKPYEQYKPILRLLSDLTKEIEINGEKFVPIIELFKMRTQHLSDSIDKYYIENDTAILKLQENAYPDGEMSYCHFFEIDIEPEAVNFSLATEYYKIDTDGIWKEEFGFVGNEFNMLQKLYEWHFDVFGLIEKGLAVSYDNVAQAII